MIPVTTDLIDGFTVRTVFALVGASDSGSLTTSFSARARIACGVRPPDERATPSFSLESVGRRFLPGRERSRNWL
jgi:hypothetical protein